MPSLPADPYAEMQLIGAILRDPHHSMLQIAGEGLITQQDIHMAEHDLIMQSIFALNADGRTISVDSVASWLNGRGNLEAAGGYNYVASLVEHAGDLEEAADLVMQAAVRRQLLFFGAGVTAKAADEARPVDDVIDELEQGLLELRRRRRQRVVPIGAIARLFRERINRQRAGTWGAPRRVGVRQIDDILGPMEDNEFLIVGGRPGDGKSTFLKWAAYQTAIAPAPEDRRGVYIADFEEGEAVVTMHFAAMISGISTTLLKNATQLSEEQLRRVMDALDILSGAPLFVDSIAGCTPSIYKSKVLDAIQQCDSEFGVPLAWHGADYIQLMVGQGESSVATNTFISHQMRALCQPDKLGLPALCSAQLSRAPVGSNGAPREYVISDLRETGALEQDASIIVFPVRPWLLSPPSDETVRRLEENVETGGRTSRQWLAEPIQWKVAKNRNGGTGKTDLLVWHRDTGRYEEDERVHDMA